MMEKDLRQIVREFLPYVPKKVIREVIQDYECQFRLDGTCTMQQYYDRLCDTIRHRLYWEMFFYTEHYVNMKDRNGED